MSTTRLPTSNEEQIYRQKFIIEDNIELIRAGTGEVLCTVCGTDLNWMVKLKREIFHHPFLEVLLCEQCTGTSFQCNADLGSSCFWCQKKEVKNLAHCSMCPRSLCFDCVKLNLGNYELMKAQTDLPWNCVVCISEKIWPQRAICNLILQNKLWDNEIF